MVKATYVREFMQDMKYKPAEDMNRGKYKWFAVRISGDMKTLNLKIMCVSEEVRVYVCERECVFCINGQCTVYLYEKLGSTTEG